MSASDSAGVATPWLQALLRPRSVAVVGASDDPKKDAARPVRFLRKHGYAGTVHAVNPRRDTVLGEKSWPALSALPERPDHVYVVTAAERVEDAVVEAARLGVPVATILADGFAEMGE
ncbi:MAG TPA: CoA-binding protein, partial [Thalassobaculum sp.]